MSENHTIYELTNLAIALEQTAETVYKGLGLLFSHEPDVAQFWNLYAEEEAGHADWLKELRAGQSEGQLNKPIDGILVEAAQQVLQKPPAALLATVNNLEDAYRLAAGFEGSETNVIFNFLITDAKLALIAKDFLRTQLNVHIERLDKEFPKQFQTRASRLSILAKRTE